MEDELIYLAETKCAFHGKFNCESCMINQYICNEYMLGATVSKKKLKKLFKMADKVHNIIKEDLK